MMAQRILVTYASRYGSSAEIAERIGEVLADAGQPNEVLSVEKVEQVEDYGAVVIGGAIYSGEWPSDLTEFIEEHEATLRQLPVAFFIVALRLREDSEEMRRTVLETVDKYRVMLQPVSIGLFAGVMDYSKLSSIVRLQMKTKNLPEGDFRDWDAIEAWATSLPESLKAK
jgi:menaquinone-dependent protoporphyrinogen oxidase